MLFPLRENAFVNQIKKKKTFEGVVVHLFKLVVHFLDRFVVLDELHHHSAVCEGEELGIYFVELLEGLLPAPLHSQRLMHSAVPRIELFTPVLLVLWRHTHTGLPKRKLAADVAIYAT